MPDLYFIAVLNSAGKTTASMTILPDVLHIEKIINAASILAGISSCSVELATSQIEKWVKHGVHRIPEDGIERRYSGGIHNLLKDFIHLCDNWGIYNSSESEPKPTCWSVQMELEIIKPKTYQSILQYVKSR
jgi:predicted ABC-type ATPase